MMPKKILIILGNPARERQSFCEALVLSYMNAATQAGHQVEFIKVSNLVFDPILHEGYKAGQPCEPDIVSSQEKMMWADHWVIVYPLWQFMLPALFKGFLERTITKGFAFDSVDEFSPPVKVLAGKTVRIFQTMGMPSFYYRWVYRRHSEKALRNILDLCGIRAVRTSFCGLIETSNKRRRQKYLESAAKLGQSGK